MFDKNRFLDNVFYLLKQKDVKIGSLEQTIGVSSGYLAKLRNDDARKNIAADLMLAISDFLQVSVDYLCNQECEGLNDDEIEVLSLFERIKKDTRNNKCKWIKESTAMILAGQSIIGQHLVTYDNFGDRAYISLFRFGEQVELKDYSYVVELSDGIYFALIRINDASSRKKIWLESYIINENDKNNWLSKICATCGNLYSELDFALEDLYKVAETSGKKLALDENTSKLIKAYLGNTGDSEDLPF